MSGFFKTIAVLLLVAGLSVFLWEFLTIGKDDWISTLITTFVLITNSLLFFSVGDLRSRVKDLEKENEELKALKTEDKDPGR